MIDGRSIMSWVRGRRKDGNVDFHGISRNELLDRGMGKENNSSGFLERARVSLELETIALLPMLQRTLGGSS